MLFHLFEITFNGFQISSDHFSGFSFALSLFCSPSLTLWDALRLAGDSH